MQKTKVKDVFLTKLEEVIAAPRLRINEPMSKHTSFRIGGPADYLVEPASAIEVAAVLKTAADFAVPVIPVGKGSNLLVRDGGIRGLVLKIGEHMSRINHTTNIVFAGAGASLGDVSRYAANFKLTGLEFAVGIPGSIGGAVFMNAGAYDGEIGNIISAVTAVCPVNGLKRFVHKDINFGYRHSIFQENSCIICEVELSLKPGDTDLITGKMEEYTYSRQTKQPVEMPSAGSTFKRPPGFFAGTLIEQSGLKGLCIGGAKVSEKHAGFIVNIGGATAKDVLALISEVQKRVFEKHGVRLQPEIRIIGEE